MCIGDNNALHAATYLNDQLDSLWKISEECARKNTPGVMPTLQQQHSSALAEWSFGRQTTPGGSHLNNAQDILFYARFGRPRLDFLCNHAALLVLNITTGRYCSNYSRATDVGSAKSTPHQGIAKTQITFRVPFDLADIGGQIASERGGSVKVDVSLFSFNLSQAQLVDVSSDSQEVSQDALRFYLNEYLCYLENTGHNIYYSLPTFGLKGDTQLDIDFSILAERLPDISEIHNVPITYITKTLTRTWLKSAMLANSSQTLQPSECGPVSLAEYRSTWSIHDGGLRFYIRFNPPELKPLCQDEVVLSFVIDEVSFYRTDDFSVDPVQTFKGWSIALLVNMEHCKEPIGYNINCQLDFTSCQFVKQFSRLDGYDETDPNHVQYHTRLLEFMTGEYLSVLESVQYHVVYRYDSRYPGSPGGLEKDEDVKVNNDHPEDSDDFKTAVPWSTIESETTLSDFSQVFAFSQSSINGFFRWLHAASQNGPLVNWGYEDYCGITFKPLTVRLLGGYRAVVYVNLEKGFLRPFRNSKPQEDGDKLEFADWRVAFEVDLTMLTHKDMLSESVDSEWLAEFEKSPAHLKHTATNKDFRHICLALRATNARFVHESSRFEGLAMTQCRSAVDYLHAVVQYIRDYYFPALRSRGYHILHTIPIWPASECNDNDQSSFLHTTDVTHYVVVKPVVQAGQRNSQLTESSVVVVGTTGNRVLPSIVPTSGWLARIGSVGTIGISQKVVLEKLLLRHLAAFNAETTLVLQPTQMDQWEVDVNKWPDNRASPDFDYEGEQHGIRRYKWENKDVYKREHYGNGSTLIEVNCSTKNSVEIPTCFKYGAMEIKLRGQTVFTKKHHDLNLGSHEEATWNASLILRTDASGLHVEVTGGTIDIGPQAPGYISPSYKMPDTLKTRLPHQISLAKVVEAFKIFEGTWQGCYPGNGSYSLINPVFSAAGDFLCELRAPWQNASAIAGAMPTSPTNPRSPLRSRGRLGVPRHLYGSTEASNQEAESRSTYAANSRAQSAQRVPTQGHPSPSGFSSYDPVPTNDFDTSFAHLQDSYFHNGVQSRGVSRGPPPNVSGRATPHRPVLEVRTNPPSRSNSPSLFPPAHRHNSTTSAHGQQSSGSGRAIPYPSPHSPSPRLATSAMPSVNPQQFSRSDAAGNTRTRSHTPHGQPGTDAAGMTQNVAGGSQRYYYTRQRHVVPEQIVPRQDGPAQQRYYQYVTSKVEVDGADVGSDMYQWGN